MFCNKCGQNLRDDATSCFNCGNVFSSVYPEDTEPKLKNTFRGNILNTTSDENYSFETNFKCSFDDGKKKKSPPKPIEPTETSYDYAYTPTVYDTPSGSRATAIIGMIIGIDALVSVSSFFYLLADFGPESCFFATIFLMGLCIVGASLSFKESPLHGMAIAGRIINLIALGIYGLLFFTTLAYL